MKPKTVAILAGVAVVAVGLAAWSLSGRGGTPADSGEKGAASGKLFTGLDVNAGASLTVTKAGQTVTIQRGEKDWTVAEKGGYPAKFETIKAAIVGLSELEILEPKTENPDLYSKIGVEDPATPEAKSTLLTLKDASGATLASVIVGQEQWQGEAQGVFVRKEGESKSYLAKGRLNLPTDTLGWMDRQVVSLQRDRVQSVTITPPEGESLAISRESKDQRDFKPQGVPEGRELTYSGVANPVAGALSYLMFEDVAPAGDLGEGVTPGATAEFRTFDGLIATVSAAQVGDKRWLRLSFAYDEAMAPPPAPPTPAAEPAGPEPEEPKAEGEPADATEDPDKAKRDEADKVRNEADDLNARLAAWDFAVSEATYKNFTMNMDGLLKPLPEPPPPEEPADSEANTDEPPPPEGGAPEEGTPPPADGGGNPK